MTDETGRSTGPIERAFTVLQAVVASPSPVGVRELGRRTGLPRSTASRLVAVLAELGMVERTADGMVVAGSALATLVPDGGPSPLLRDRLRPLLLALSDQHEESAALAVDDGDAVRYVSQVDAPSAIRAPDVEYERHPFHVVAHGLVLMAAWPRDRLESYLAGPLEAGTGRAEVNPDRIRRRLDQTRVDGHVWTEEEFAAEVNGLAVPVFDAETGAVTAAVGLYGPSYRLAPATRPGLASAVMSAVGSFVTSPG